jgi:hypothetical protein
MAVSRRIIELRGAGQQERDHQTGATDLGVVDAASGASSDSHKRLAQAATRNPQLEAELSGVFELRAETR